MIVRSGGESSASGVELYKKDVVTFLRKTDSDELFPKRVFQIA